MRLGSNLAHHGLWIQCAGMWTHNVVIRDAWSEELRLNTFNQHHQTVVCDIDPLSLADWFKFRATWLTNAM
jgi:hypothetical protein